MDSGDGAELESITVTGQTGEEFWPGRDGSDGSVYGLLDMVSERS